MPKNKFSPFSPIFTNFHHFHPFQKSLHLNLFLAKNYIILISEGYITRKIELAPFWGPKSISPPTVDKIQWVLCVGQGSGQHTNVIWYLVSLSWMHLYCNQLSTDKHNGKLKRVMGILELQVKDKMYWTL